ncbi:ATP-binding protein [Elstera sp.]|uniref:ATP-binding protein n=1 Tax=Elstera sp. TaxID=1916664 RepID=UPI0037BF6CE0
MVRAWWKGRAALPQQPVVVLPPLPLPTVFVVDGIIRSANPAFRRLLGVNDPVDRPLFSFISEGQEAVAQALAGVQTVPPPVEVDLIAEPGRETRCAARLYFERWSADGGPSGWLLQAVDISDQKELENRIVQSQKMQAVGQLAGGIAHDFNNLLTAMIGYCDLLLQRHRAGDASFADIMQIKQNGNRAAALVRQLLAFSRQQKLEVSQLDISDVLAELSHLLRRLIGQGIELELHHGRDLGLVRVDPGQLEQVIINLAVNARDAMPNGGRLTVATQVETVKFARRMGHETMAPGNYVAISVTDTGSGMSPDVQARIFEPFFTTKPVGSGTGLGLSTVYGIVRQTGGFVKVDSTIGIGTTFTIYLPQMAAVEESESPSDRRDAAPPDVPSPEVGSGGRGAILIVEDEDPVRAFAARTLRSKGYHVTEARSAEAALDLIRGGLPRPDLLITDVVMPGMDGPTMVREIWLTFPNLPVICVSGHADGDLRDQLNALGEITFLQKPFSLKQLAAKVADRMTAHF